MLPREAALMEVKLVSGVILFFGILTAIEIILQRAELFLGFVAAFSQSTKRVLGKRHRLPHKPHHKAKRAPNVIIFKNGAGWRPR
jgi:hypothetical protein